MVVISATHPDYTTLPSTLTAAYGNFCIQTVKMGNDISRAHAIHPECEAQLQLLSSGPEPIVIETMQLVDLREKMLEMNTAFGGNSAFDGTREEIHVLREAADIVPCWVYRPSSAAGKSNTCICIFIHGGGFISGNRITYDVACKNIADRGACIVVSVEYRLAPEHKNPACYEDCTAVVQWVLENKTVLGGSDASLVGVAGDSAGGNIAASLCHTVPGIAFQALVYPFVDFTCSHPSLKEFGQGYMLTDTIIERCINDFLRKHDDKTDAVLSPLFRQSFTGLPPALFVMAACDPLRDEGIAYAQKLEDAGVPVQVVSLNGCLHGFFNQAGAFPENCEQAYEAIGQFLQKF